jgi:ribosomal protein L11 methyltransferase
LTSSRATIPESDSRVDLSRPLRIGRRILVVPIDYPLQAQGDDILVRMDPGGAFGSGAHPTTRLCLRTLERRLVRGDTVADLGTGTGILAIAAAGLGAAEVLAVDTDPEAVRVASGNIAANGMQNRIRVRRGSLAEVLAEQADRGASLVMVNILAGIVETLFAEGLALAVRPGGLLALSGLVAAQTPGVRACLQWHGLRQAAQEQEGDWVCILAQRLPPGR